MHNYYHSSPLFLFFSPPRLTISPVPPDMDTEDDVSSDEHNVSDYYDDDVVSSDSDFTPETNSGDRHKKSYTVLSIEDIKRIQHDRISRVTSSLYVSSAFSRVLLNKFKWNVNELQESWFVDEEKIRNGVGLVEKKSKTKIKTLGNELNCSICFDDFLSDDKVNACVLCDHCYCNCCWTGYISNAISEGSGCLSLRCPDPDCDAVVTDELVNYLVCEDYKLRYERFCVGAYVEGNDKVKWCPGPDCGFAVEYDDGVGRGDEDGYDVVCDCGYCFCCNCGENGHRPVDCKTVAKWVAKNNAESENTTWILVYTKPCPKCRRPIEKNEGCMHMTCRRPCGFSFCWVCLEDWSNHGYKPCNAYAGSIVRENYDEEERVKQRAKISLERYTHYFERWAANNKSMKKSFSDLQKMQTVNLDILLAKHAQSSSQLEFVLDAWTQIVECRRVLKWTYAYGYYLPEDDVAKTKLFEYLQGMAEAALEKLHHCAEKELTEFLIDGTTAEFNSTFREKLANLTSVTGTYFANLVKALESGLADVESGVGCSTSESANKKLKTGN